MATTAVRHRHNSHSHKRPNHLLSKRISLKPLKKMNKNLVSYVHKKPYQSIGIATLLVGAVIGFIYARIKL